MSSASESPSSRQPIDIRNTQQRVAELIAACDGNEWSQIATRFAARLAEIELLARRHCSPASNPGAHALAAKIIQIIERQP